MTELGWIAGASGLLYQAEEENRWWLFGGGVWEVGREITIDWAWREWVEIALDRPMRGRENKVPVVFQLDLVG